MGILSYLNRSQEIGITYSPSMEIEFLSKFGSDGQGKPVVLSPYNLYADASGYCEIDDGYSIGGYVFCLYGVPIAWKSRRQSVRAFSTCEAEYVALADAINWAEIWGHIPFFIWKERDIDPKVGGLPPSTVVWTDSLSARDVAASDLNRPKARWMAIRWYTVKDHRMRLKFCSTSNQRADVLTKPPTQAAVTSILSSQGTCPLAQLR